MGGEHAGRLDRRCTIHRVWLLLALYFFIQGMTTSAPQQVNLYFVISALGWVIVVLSFMMTLVTDIIEELRQLNKTALNVLPE